MSFLKTQNIGTIDTVFSDSKVQLIFGDYVLATKDFCKLNEKIVKSYASPDFKIKAIDSMNELYCLKQSKHDIINASTITLDNVNMLSSMLNNTEFKNNPFEYSSNFIKRDGKNLNVHVAKTTLLFGKYQVNPETFADFATYVIRGGYSGWERNAAPKFALNAAKAILNSESELFTTKRRDELKHYIDNYLL